MNIKKYLSAVLLTGLLMIPVGQASASEPAVISVGDSVSDKISEGNVLVMTPEEMEAEGVGTAKERAIQGATLASLTGEQRASQAELRDEVNAGLEAAGISRGESAEMITSVTTNSGEVSPFIWQPACWTSSNYYEVQMSSSYNGTAGAKHCFANAGSISFNAAFAYTNTMASIRPGNNRGYVMYQYEGVYYNSITRGPDYGTYYFDGSGSWLFGVTIY